MRIFVYLFTQAFCFEAIDDRKHDYSPEPQEDYEDHVNPGGVNPGGFVSGPFMKLSKQFPVAPPHYFRLNGITFNPSRASDLAQSIEEEEAQAAQDYEEEEARAAQDYERDYEAQAAQDYEPEDEAQAAQDYEPEYEAQAAQDYERDYEPEYEARPIFSKLSTHFPRFPPQSFLKESMQAGLNDINVFIEE